MILCIPNYHHNDIVYRVQSRQSAGLSALSAVNSHWVLLGIWMVMMMVMMIIGPFGQGLGLISAAKIKGISHPEAITLADSEIAFTIKGQYHSPLI